MSEIILASAVRTAGAKFDGALAQVSAPELGAKIVAEIIKRNQLDPRMVDEVIWGTGWQAGIGPNVGRVATVKGGLSHETPAFTINKRCGSSLRAVVLATQIIKAGDASLMLAGGSENSSQVPYIAEGARWGARMGDVKLIDVLHKDGFMCPLAEMLMGNTAELLVEKYAISRQEQDAWAVESHQKAARAVKAGKFKAETMTVEIRQKKEVIPFASEEIVREDISVEKLAKLPTVFKKDGTITAGNACALCDSASGLLVATAERAQELGIKPMAKIRAYAVSGVEPKFMGIGPVPAIQKALAKAGLSLSDIDIIELNEAFAAQVIAVERELKWDRSRVNIYGGAIALGHPVGATGTKILTTLLHALEQEDKQLGLAGLCIGGGQGVALVVERM
jgi:acetyl-CoA C-acetyltransferase